MSAKQLRIGLIGTGFMGRAHSNAYRKAPNFFDLDMRPVMQAVCARSEGRQSATCRCVLLTRTRPRPRPRSFCPCSTGRRGPRRAWTWPRSRRSSAARRRSAYLSRVGGFARL